MIRAFGMAILIASMAGFVFGDGVSVPEIDASSGATALGLLAGGLLILRSRRKKS
jgi:hypothetical protein